MIIYSYPPQPSVTVSSAPIEFSRNGVDTTVAENTATPANNRALPSQLMIYKDGVQLPINKSSSVVADTVAVPVEIVGASGAVITITAGDINVQLTDQGANPDVTRIGNGTNQLGINASLEALVHDADSLVQISAINTKTPALVGGMVPVDTGLVQGLTDTQIRASALPVSGPLTDAQLRATPVPISGSITTSGLSDTELRATPVPISGALTDSQLRATAVPISGALTDTELRATALPVSSGQLPATLGQLAAANSVSVVLATGTAISSPVLTPTYQEDLSVTTSAETIVAPADARWCKIMCDETNTANMRIKIGGTATSTSGMQFQPGRSEDYSAVGDISYAMESGTGKIYVQFGA